MNDTRHNNHSTASHPNASDSSAATFAIQGMTCASCVNRVEKALANVPGVHEANVNFATRKASVKYDESATDPATLAKAVEDIGYKAEVLSAPKPAASVAAAAHHGSGGAADHNGAGTLTPDEPETAKEAKANLGIQGITCASCVRRVEKALTGVPGVSAATVNFATRKAAVTYDPAATSPDALEKAVSDVGYGASVISAPGPAHASHTAHTAPSRPKKQQHHHGEAAGHDHMSHDEDYDVLKRKLIIATILTIPLLVMAMSHGQISWLTGDWVPGVQLLLASPVVLYAGSHFFVAAWKALKHRTADMNTLIAVGAGTAYAFSVVATLFPNLIPHTAGPGGEHHGPPIYFEAAAAIITLILLGRLLEARARNRAGDAIEKLIGMQPRTARIRRNGEETDVSIEEVVPGDHVIIRPGERLPVDGRVIEGSSSIDESMLTGESMPITKNAGDSVFSGTINSTGSITYEAEKTGEESALQRIVQMVEEAQSGKAPIARLADRISAVFTPTVIVIAILSFIGWMIWGPADDRVGMAVLAFVSVLIIACPCALGLATPTAIMVGTGRGASEGILIRNAQSLETAHRLDTVILDKTGTITRGKPEVTTVVPLGDWQHDELLRLASSAEANSEHPLAAAVVRYGQQKDVQVPAASNFQSHSGKGIEASVDGRTVIVGNPAFIRSQGVDLTAAEDEIHRLASEGNTVVVVAVEGSPAGLIAIADQEKPESAEAIRGMHEAGLRVLMVTGDNRPTAEAIARRMGIDEVLAEVLPENKADEVRKLQESGKTVAMAGDGINDAPALAQADIGIAMGTGTDVAMESSDITLIRGDLRLITKSIRLSDATYATIKQNLFWAFIYNIIGIPIAAGALYPVTGWMLSPIIASAAMSFSSVFVVGNSLRLRKKKIQ